MTRALVLTGGFTKDHDFATTGLLVDLLKMAGIEAEVEDDVDAGLTRLGGPEPVDLVASNILWWTMAAPAYGPYRDRFAFSPSAAARRGLSVHLGAGGGLLAMHTSAICFDDWPEWSAVLGARWVWGKSGHPPLGQVRVEVASAAHPITAGATDFDVVDEIYGHLDLAADVEPLAWGRGGGERQPLVWARRHGGGRIVTDLLGHDHRSYESAPHAAIITAAIDWLTSGPPGR